MESVITKKKIIRDVTPVMAQVLYGVKMNNVIEICLECKSKNMRNGMTKPCCLDCGAVYWFDRERNKFINIKKPPESKL